MTWECDAVAVCSGLHVTPSIPNVPGAAKVPVVKHSAEFKSREEFGTDRTVVVLGTGETGIDMAYLAVTSPTKRVILCHRDGFLGAPKVNMSLLSRSSGPQLLHSLHHGGHGCTTLTTHCPEDADARDFPNPREEAGSKLRQRSGRLQSGNSV